MVRTLYRLKDTPNNATDSGPRYPPTNEMFFVQNAGAPAAGTGLNKSAIIQKISLTQADTFKTLQNATGKVNVSTVPSTPQVINPNGKPLKVPRFRGELI